MRTLTLAAVVLVLLPAADAWSQPSKKKEKVSEATQKNPQLEGKTLQQWIAEIKHPDPSRKESAILKLLLFDAELSQQAVPTLLSELKRGTFANPVDTSIRVHVPIVLGIILGNLKERDPKYVHMTDVVDT